MSVAPLPKVEQEPCGYLKVRHGNRVTQCQSINEVSLEIFNPLPHCGRPYWPIPSSNKNCSNSAEGKAEAYCKKN